MIRWLVKSFASVDSTQTVAGRLGLDGAPEGTVVVAGRQTAGRGRHGRVWVSPEGGLYMSVLVRPSSLTNVQTLTLVAALAVVRGIEDTTSLDAQIRWPNDVIIEGKKAAGVIAESSFRDQTLSFATIGFGVNCNSKVHPTDPQASHATSLHEELGHEVDIASLRQSILNAFGDLYASWLRGADAVEVARDRISTLGKRVSARTVSGQTLEGLAEDVEPAGALVIKLNDRKLKLQPHDVEWLRET